MDILVEAVTPVCDSVSVCVCRYDVVLKWLDLTKLAMDVLVDVQAGGGCSVGGGHPQSVTAVSVCVCRYGVVLKRLDLTMMAVDVLVEAATPSL